MTRMISPTKQFSVNYASVRLWIAIMEGSLLLVQPGLSSQHRHHPEPRLSNYPYLVSVWRKFRGGGEWVKEHTSPDVMIEQEVLDGKVSVHD